MMHRLRFRFADLHPDAPDLPADLDWLLRFVAGLFEVRVDGELVFDELDFPVVEAASVLDQWVSNDMPRARELSYEVTGGAPGTLLIRPAGGSWLVDSVHRSPDVPSPPPLTDADVRSGVRVFIDELARETKRDYDYDVHALLRRVRGGAPR